MATNRGFAFAWYAMRNLISQRMPSYACDCAIDSKQPDERMNHYLVAVFLSIGLLTAGCREDIDISKMRSVDIPRSPVARETTVPASTPEIPKAIIPSLQDAGQIYNHAFLKGEITDAQAVRLSRMQGVLLDSITTISDTQAEILSKVKHISLNGLRKISDKQAASLAKVEGSISLKGLSTITDAQAESFGESNALDIGLNGLKTITDAQAESLSMAKSVGLSGLITITDTQARILVKKESLSLPELKSITDSQAEILGQVRFLDLNGLTKITSAQAESLGKVHTHLSLNGLTNINETQAKGLSENPVFILEMDGLDSISDLQAEILGKISCLHLNGLKVITDSQADTLGRVSRISLNGLATITDAQARSLSKVEHLSLNSLAFISDDQTASLAKVEGSISLNGLSAITDAQAESFGESNALDIGLNGLKTITDAQAESLSKIEARLSLDGLTSMTDAQAKSLCKVKRLSLSGLTTISDVQAGLIDPTGRIRARISATKLRPTFSKIPQPRKPLLAFDTSIYEINADGSSMNVLGRVDGYRYHALPFFSPDRQQLSWSAKSKTTSQSALFLRDVNGTVTRQINGIEEGLWLNDKTLLISKDGNLVKIAVNDDTNESILMPGMRPSLSHNRRFLAYESNGKLFVRNLESNEDTAVTLNPPANTFNRFSISNDGKQIAYVGNGPRRSIYLSDLTTGESKLIAEEEGAEFWPKFSHDHKRLLFTAGDFNVGVGSQLNRIYLADIKEKRSQPVTPERYHCRDASWSPDGQSIVFVAVDKWEVDAGF